MKRDHGMAVWLLSVATLISLMSAHKFWGCSTDFTILSNCAYLVRMGVQERHLIT